MINSTKFIAFSKKIETAEWKRFRRFLKSPYFNTNQQLLVIADALRKFHPEYDHEDCTKEKIFAKIYKGKKVYSDQNFNTLMRQLVKLANQFLLHEQLENEEVMQRQLRLKALKEHQLDDWFFKEAERQKNALLLEEERGEEFHYSMFLLNEEVYMHPKTLLNAQKIPCLADSLFHLEQYILASSLQWELVNENSKFIKKTSYQTPILSLINNSEIAAKTKDSALRFSKEMIQYLKSPTEKSFLLLSDSFFENFPQFTELQSKNLLLSFFNILTSKIRKQKKQYLKIGLKVYKLGFSKGIFIGKQGLSQTTFLNAITIGCGCHDFDWVDEVMAKYSKYLPDAQQEDTLKYGKLLYYYLQGNAKNDKDYFDKVIDVYNDVQQIPKQFSISSRSILCRTYYELLDKRNADTTLLESLCNAFFIYLERNLAKKTPRRKVFETFLQNMRELIKILNTPDKTVLLMNFENNLAKDKDIFAYEWFVKKIRELKSIP